MFLLDLIEEELKCDDFVDYFSGNKLLFGVELLVYCYCGY